MSMETRTTRTNSATTASPAPKKKTAITECDRCPTDDLVVTEEVDVTDKKRARTVRLCADCKKAHEYWTAKVSS